MCHDVYGIIHSNPHPASGETYQTESRDEESFLRDIITPIYEVLAKVSMNHQELY